MNLIICSSSTETFDLNPDQISPSIAKNSLDTSPCPQCGRKFVTERLSKHIEACRKLSSKKRKPFDSKLQRQATTDSDSGTTMYRSHSPIQSTKMNQKSAISRTVAVNVITTTTSPAVATTTTAVSKAISINRTGTNGNGAHNGTSKFHNEMDTRPKSNWREQHEEFIRTVRAARGVKVDDPIDVDEKFSGSKKVPPGYIKCPTCERSFNRKAADRHIEWCAEKKSLTTSNRSSPQSLDAMAKFKARSTYKPPVEPTRTKNTKNVQVTPSSGKSTGSVTSRKNTRNSTIKSSFSASNLKEAKSNETINMTASNLRHSTDRLSNVRGRSSDRSTSKSSNSTSNNKGQANGYFSGISSIIPNTGSKVKAFLASSNNKVQPKTPIVKFKDKFPLAANGNSLNYMTGSDSLQELLKRPTEHETYSKQPKTVPGVRTGGGGASPVKSIGSFEQQGNGSASNFASSLSIMKRSLDDLMLFNSSKSNGTRNSIPTANGSNSVLNHRASVVTLTNGVNSIGLNGLHGSTTSINGNGGNSIDSGLMRGSTSGSSQDDQVMEQRKNSLTTSEDSSNGTITNRMGSGGNNSNLPRWCHQCGTKYPMHGAKYCYECGARRLGTLASMIG